MAIKVGQAFERTSAQPIDTSLTLTKAQMVTVNDNLMPPYYFTICQDDGKIYLYDKSATASASTGKFTEFSGGSGSGSPVYLSATLLDKDVNDPTIVALSNLTKADNPTVHPILSEIVLGTTVIYDADGTMGVATAKSETNVTVTTATTSTPTKELTQAEYDALTEAEKKNGTIYFITDNYVGSTYVGAYDTIYSTTERVVGSYMGKPLYQCTWSGLNLSITQGSWTVTNIESTNIQQILFAQGTKSSAGLFIPLEANPTENNHTKVGILGHRTDSNIDSVTLQYTKTTDSTSPVEYASPNDYSTSEKIVGTWIDGKPLYQKTITGSISALGTWNEYNHGISNLGTCVDIKGIASMGGGYQWVFTGYRDNFTYMAVNISSTKVRFFVGNSEAMLNQPIHFTIQYTKTTD